MESLRPASPPASSSASIASTISAINPPSTSPTPPRTSAKKTTSRFSPSADWLPPWPSSEQLQQDGGFEDTKQSHEAILLRICCHSPLQLFKNCLPSVGRRGCSRIAFLP